MEQSSFRYDFPLFCNYGRFAQMIALLVQTYVAYSEWDRIGTGVFFPLVVIFAVHGHNAFVRWRDSIDGRFDVKQMLSCSNNSLRAQYALAVLLAPVLSLVSWWFLYPEGINLFNSTLYFFATLVKVVCSCGILFLEAFEVSKEKFSAN
ncbi:hypothetical protein PRIPAC_86160 [Pristionchus pacificus]|uniref:DUF7087 domain-containing protein n=1 Tax=Pristionchus pacificus TaxID=54126 RepID=A0A454Y1G6_PRIPA|nr:hypothetical protein PRIPAC_86160 [Pristionchus pacificus]|eukprot:PDM67208.1 hypothetical protein PRIPAC_48625 [Pristionchus pacificus]